MTLPNDPSIDPEPPLRAATATSQAAEPNLRRATPPSTEFIQAVDASARAGRTSVWRKLLRDPQAVITIAILAGILLLGILATVIAPQYCRADAAENPSDLK